MGRARDIIALDVGSKRIGVARANPIARLPEPLGIVAAADGYDPILQIADRHNAGTVVVGLPRNMSGQETAQTAEIRRWAEGLAPLLADKNIDLVLSDETLSTVTARSLHAGIKHIDEQAACQILQMYLEGAARV